MRTEHFFLGHPVECRISKLKSYIADDSQLCQHFHDLEPDSNVLSSLSHSSPGLTHELLSVQSDLHPVVEESKEWSKREGSNKDGDETKLKN